MRGRAWLPEGTERRRQRPGGPYDVNCALVEFTLAWTGMYLERGRRTWLTVQRFWFIVDQLLNIIFLNIINFSEWNV